MDSIFHAINAKQAFVIGGGSFVMAGEAIGTPLPVSIAIGLLSLAVFAFLKSKNL